MHVRAEADTVENKKLGLRTKISRVGDTRGGEVRLSLGRDAARDEVLENCRDRMGLNRPPVERFSAWAGDLAQFDLGVSMKRERPIVDIVGPRLRNTLILAVSAALAGVPLAIGLGVAPMAMIFTVLFGASQSFLSPVGYQTNLMVFGPGRYRFLDMTRYGAPLTIGLAIVVPWLICRQFGI